MLEIHRQKIQQPFKLIKLDACFILVFVFKYFLQNGFKNYHKFHFREISVPQASSLSNPYFEIKDFFSGWKPEVH